MRAYHIAAATLFLGTSALAWTPSAAPGKDMADKDMAKIATMEMKTAAPTFYKAGAASVALGTAVSQPADKPKAEMAAWNDADGKVQTLSADGWSKVDFPSKLDSEAELAAYGKVDSGQTGMGGPLELVDAEAGAKPKPAMTAYPACGAGPGDDSCIQLYEPGVRAQLTHSAASKPVAAMGGPYEAIDSATLDPKTEAGLAAMGDNDMEAAAPRAAGISGPSVGTGYRACAPGAGDDNCIQLYERGVTGAGN